MTRRGFLGAIAAAAGIRPADKLPSAPPGPQSFGGALEIPGSLVPIEVRIFSESTAAAFAAATVAQLPALLEGIQCRRRLGMGGRMPRAPFRLEDDVADEPADRDGDDDDTDDDLDDEDDEDVDYDDDDD